MPCSLRLQLYPNFSQSHRVKYWKVKVGLNCREMSTRETASMLHNVKVWNCFLSKYSLTFMIKYHRSKQNTFCKKTHGAFFCWKTHKNNKKARVIGSGADMTGLEQTWIQWPILREWRTGLFLVRRIPAGEGCTFGAFHELSCFYAVLPYETNFLVLFETLGGGPIMNLGHGHLVPGSTSESENLSSLACWERHILCLGSIWNIKHPSAELFKHFHDMWPSVDQGQHQTLESDEEWKRMAASNKWCDDQRTRMLTV